MVTSATGTGRVPASTSNDLPVHWDVALDATEVTMVDHDRSAARADVTFEIPLKKLGLTKAEAKALLARTTSSSYLSPGAREPDAKLELKGDTLRISAKNVDGRGLFASKPVIRLTDRTGAQRTITLSTPKVTLKENDPLMRDQWATSKGALQQQKNAIKLGFQNTEAHFREQKAEVKADIREQKTELPSFSVSQLKAEQAARLEALREGKREARETYREQKQQLREDRREARHDRREAARADRKGLVQVSTNQTH